MTIYLPHGLPAARQLHAAGFTVGDAAVAPGAGTLRIGLLNLMPQKAVTELHIARQLAAMGRRIKLVLICPKDHCSRSTPQAHIEAFYRTPDQIMQHGLDGLIVTGAPIELLPFEQVTYWNELQAFLDWSRERVASKLFICWGAQAALYHYHGVPKHRLPRKAFGVFRHQVFRHGSPIVEGLGPQFQCPVSRHTEVRWNDLRGVPNLHVAAAAQETGPGLLEDRSAGHYYMFNHLEYEVDTLAGEYRRDLRRGLRIEKPANYFPDDDAARPPTHNWASAAQQFYGNWVGQVIVRSSRQALRISRGFPAGLRGHCDAA